MNCNIGIDIGSISTKGVIIDDNHEIIARLLPPGRRATQPAPPSASSPSCASKLTRTMHASSARAPRVAHAVS